MKNHLPCSTKSLEINIKDNLPNETQDNQSNEPHMNTAKRAVFISCNDNYVAKSLVVLANFIWYNPGYDKYVIGTQFSEENHELAKKHNVQLLEINLHTDFYRFNERPYGLQYPIEMFYHFYAYKLLPGYDFLVNIEADMYINQKLDIDWSSIEYIAGAGARTKKNLNRIQIDLPKIRKIYRVYDKIHRILGGFRIYCPRNLEKISFYEKIVEYYQKSWEINAPRCGDDSLMVMYQLINHTHVTLLPSEYNTIPIHNNYTMNDIPNIVVYHLFGYNKPWNDRQNVSKLTQYFRSKYIKFLYDHFDLEFIQRHYPKQYIDIQNVRLRFYYYNRGSNFGDLFTLYFLKKFCREEEYEFYFGVENIPKIISCGSIMRLCNKNTLVYGSGIRDIDQKIYPGIIQMVRGPLTRQRLQEIGCHCPPVYGDPGLLLPLYYYPSVAKTYRLGIIPHFTQYKRINKLYKDEPGVRIINLSTPSVERTIDEILSCERTISSSLHGLIVSDAYNIPNKWVQYDNNICGDNTKYYDYFKSVQREDQEFIDCLKYKKMDVEEIISMISPVCITVDLAQLKENMFFDENGIKPYTKYLYRKLEKQI